ncbi:MAG: hypothetical protein GXO14_00270 [Thermococci archaeon]|nr:hypothetical protein [Thermococci archaeon]
MSLFQWLGTILVSGGVSWLVAWYQLRRHEDIDAKKEHLNQIKKEIVTPLLNMLNMLELEELGVTISLEDVVPSPLFGNVKTYHFPELSVLDEYLDLCRKLNDTKELLKPLVKEKISNALKTFPNSNKFQPCTVDHSFELAIEKAIYSFLSSNLHRLNTWDWQRDFEGSFEANISSGYLEVKFNTFNIYKESAPKGTSAENWAGPVNVLLSSIIKSLVNSNSVKQIAEDLAKLEQQRSKKRNELKKVLEHIKYVQKLPLRKRRWRIIKEPCPCLKDY